MWRAATRGGLVRIGAVARDRAFVLLGVDASSVMAFDHAALRQASIAMRRVARQLGAVGRERDVVPRELGRHAANRAAPQVRRKRIGREVAEAHAAGCALIAVVTQLRTITGRCIHERVCILASASTIAAAFGGCQAGSRRSGSQVAMTMSYQARPSGLSTVSARHHARQERGVDGDAQHVRLEPLGASACDSGPRRERPDLAEAAPHRQPVQPVDRPGDAARAHDATGRLQQLLASRERLRRHAREQQLEPGQARRARQARGVAAQRVGARRRRGLALPGAQRALAARRHQQREQHGLQLARRRGPATDDRRRRARAPATALAPDAQCRPRRGRGPGAGARRGQGRRPWESRSLPPLEHGRGCGS